MSEPSYCQGCLRQEEIAALEAENARLCKVEEAAKNLVASAAQYIGVQEHSFRRDGDRLATAKLIGEFREKLVGSIHDLRRAVEAA